MFMLAPSWIGKVASFHLVEHCRVLHLERHGHARHAEVIQRAVLDRQLAGVLIDLLDFALGQCVGVLLRSSSHGGVLAVVAHIHLRGCIGCCQRETGGYEEGAKQRRQTGHLKLQKKSEITAWTYNDRVGRLRSVSVTDKKARLAEKLVGMDGHACPYRARTKQFSGEDGQARGGRSGCARSTDARVCWSKGAVMDCDADTGGTATKEGAIGTQEPHDPQVAHLPP